MDSTERSKNNSIKSKQNDEEVGKEENKTSENDKYLNLDLNLNMISKSGQLFNNSKIVAALINIVKDLIMERSENDKLINITINFNNINFLINYIPNEEIIQITYKLTKNS